MRTLAKQTALRTATAPPMLLLGTQDKTARLIEAAREPFLILATDAQAEAFAEAFPDADIFNPRRHSFTIARDYRSVREFADTLFPDKDLMTYRNGKRALVELLLDTTTPLHKLAGDDKDPAIAEALATVKDMLRSPVLKRVLTRKPNFSFDRSVIAKMDGLYAWDAQILASLLIGQFAGQVLVPDGFYLRPLHMSLIREGRLVAGLNTLSEVSKELQQALLTIPEKYGAGCTYEDAVVLASYARKPPHTDGWDTFITDAMCGAQ